MIPALFIAAAILASVLMLALGIYCARRDWKAKQSLLASAIAWDREIREYRRGGKPPAGKPAIPPAPPLTGTLDPDACARECVSYFWPKNKVDLSTRAVAHREVAGIIRRFSRIAPALLLLALASPAWGQTPDSEPHAGLLLFHFSPL